MSEDTRTLNIYQKLTAVRLTIQGENIKKSGYNEVEQFAYWELSDFLPKVNVLFEASGLFGGVTFNATDATLVVVDMDSIPLESITFNCPMPKITGDVRNTGKCMTYIRRYLYLHCLELVEQCEIDAEGRKAKAKAKASGNLEKFMEEPELPEVKS